MKYQIFFLLLSLGFLLIISCNDTNGNTDTACGDSIIVDVNYSTTTGDGFILMNTEITDNCLTATIQYSGGCDDSLVSYQLLGTTAAFPFSLPALLEIKIILDDNDECEALVTKEIYFDLTPLENEGYNNINVALEGWDEVLAYQF